MYIEGTLTIRGVGEILSSQAARELAQPEKISLLIRTNGSYYGLLKAAGSTRTDNIWTFTVPMIVGNEWLHNVAPAATQSSFHTLPLVDGDEFMIWAFENNKLRGLKYAHGITEEIRRAFSSRLKRDKV